MRENLLLLKDLLELLKITAMVSCSKSIWNTIFSDYRRVRTTNLLHTKSLPNAMQKICSSNAPVVTGICIPNKSGARHHRSLKLD